MKKNISIIFFCKFFEYAAQFFTLKFAKFSTCSISLCPLCPLCVLCGKTLLLTYHQFPPPSAHHLNNVNPLCKPARMYSHPFIFSNRPVHVLTA